MHASSFTTWIIDTSWTKEQVTKNIYSASLLSGHRTKRLQLCFSFLVFPFSSVFEVTIQKSWRFFDLIGKYNIKYDCIFKNLDSDMKIIHSCTSSLPKQAEYFKTFCSVLSAYTLTNLIWGWILVTCEYSDY